MAKPRISILAVDDEESLLQSVKFVLEGHGYSVDLAPNGVDAIAMLQDFPFDVVLLDIVMPGVSGIEVLALIKDQYPDTEVIMLTALQDVKTVVECMKLGAYYYLTKPYNTDNLLALLARALERRKLSLSHKVLERQRVLTASSTNMIGQSEAFLDMLNLALRAAPTESSVLIQGASGTGKELIANFVHANSLRKDQPFLALNCSSLPESLLESELFGHEKGAFTDAKQAKQGLVEMAHGGTLFLDEIGEMSMTIQPKVLRFLQTREYRRVGGNTNRKSDVRIISATNKDLRTEAAERRFREDLLYRVNVITLQLPLLKERKDDIPFFVQHFLTVKAGTKEPKQLDKRALDLLMKYDWPGNIRELENVIERAAVLSRGNAISADDLALPLGSMTSHDASYDATSKGIHVGDAVSLVEIQKAHIKKVLDSLSWNKELAAKILGMSVKTLYSKIHSYGLVEQQ